MQEALAQARTPHMKTKKRSALLEVGLCSGKCLAGERAAGLKYRRAGEKLGYTHSSQPVGRDPMGRVE